MRKDDIEEAELERERQALADREEEEEEERKRKRERQAQEEEEEEGEERPASRADDFGYWSEMDREEYARRAAISKRVEKGVAFALVSFGVAAIAGGLLCAITALTGGRYRE